MPPSGGCSRWTPWPCPAGRVGGDVVLGPRETLEDAFALVHADARPPVDDANHNHRALARRGLDADGSARRRIPIRVPEKVVEHLPEACPVGDDLQATLDLDRHV